MIQHSACTLSMLEYMMAGLLIWLTVCVTWLFYLEITSDE